MKTILKETGARVKVTVLAAVLAYVGMAPQVGFAAGAESVVIVGSKLKIVPTLGYSFFNIQGSGLELSSKGGSSASVLVQMPILDGEVELESGLEYLETGASMSAGFFSFATIDINQIAVPLRAKYVFNPKTEKTRWYGKAGLTPTYVVSANMNVLGQKSDISSSVNAAGALTQVGIGADWGHEIISGRVSMDVTYNYGLTKVLKDEGGTSTGFLVQAGYVISL